MKYIENEIKVLEINVNEVIRNLEKMGAKKVFDGNRTIIHFDNKEKMLQKSGIDIRITEEDSIKLSVDKIIDGRNSSIKLKISRSKEMIDFLETLNIIPVAKTIAHRTSYELNDIDFDIDEFKDIPPFLEIDSPNLNNIINDIIKKLDLSENKIIQLSTKAIYSQYGKNYFTVNTF